MKKRFDIYKILFVVNLFLLPVLASFLVVILNNYEKFDSLFKTIILLSIIACVVILTISFNKLNKQKRIFSKIHIFKKISFASMFLVFVFEVGFLVNFVYYNDTFKNWLITSSMGSIEHKGIAEKLYSKYTVDKIAGQVDELQEDVINFDVDYDIALYANEYEKEILDREEGQLYKIIKISGNTEATGAKYVGYIAVIYDPSHVKLAKSEGAGTHPGAYGETLATIARKNNALVAMNAGGFYDPNWNSNGGIPHGDVFIDGQLDSTYTRGDFGGGLIGFTKDNKLVLKRMSTEEAIEMGIRDAVDWGPFLIVDGVNRYRNETEYWECGRSAIGQRADGIVLMVVIDNLQSQSKGMSYSDLANLFERYGAINASSLDGGTSTSMIEKGEFVNSPWNGYKPTYRWLPNAWIVTE